MSSKVRVHPTADVSDGVEIGDGTSVWHQAQVREGARIGCNCILGKGVYVDSNVVVGSNVKLQNNASVYHGVTIEDGVFVGPHVCFTNDKVPRAVNPDGSLKGVDDWEVGRTLVKRGASIGANATIVCETVIGEWAIVGAGATVTADVPNHGLVVGNPARLIGFVCSCGSRLGTGETVERHVAARCARCGMVAKIPVREWRKVS